MKTILAKALHVMLPAGLMLAAVVPGLSTAPVYADDTEIFFSGSTASTNAKVLFVLDTGSAGSGGGGSRYGSLITAIQNVMTLPQNAGIGLNAGVVEYSGSNGIITRAMRDVNSETGNGQTIFETLTAAADLNSNAPIHLGIEEAARYYMGMNAETTAVGTGSDPADPSAWVGNSVVAGAPYNSADAGSCGNNNIVFLTFNQNSSADFGDFRSPYNAKLAGGTTQLTNTACEGSGAPNADACGQSIVNHLYNQNPLKVKSFSVYPSGTNGQGQLSFVQALGTAGGGGYYAFSDAASLQTVISQIIQSILDSSVTFVQSGVTVNQLNRLQNDDNLYFALFSPSAKDKWAGNVKGFQLANATLIDRDGLSAVDTTTGQFKDCKAGDVGCTDVKRARSYWSPAGNSASTDACLKKDDGNDTECGGASSQLPTTRIIYGNTGDTNYGLTQVAATASAFKSLVVDGTTATDTSAEQEAVLTWALNSSQWSGTGEGKGIGDPLHSRPAILSYPTATVGTVDSRLLVATNQGYLHNFYVSNGSQATGVVANGRQDTGDVSLQFGVEKWAFIPNSQFKRLSKFKINATSLTDQSRYGLDSNISVYHADSDADGLIDTDEKAYIAFGMGRGGKNIYVMDVSNKDTPVLLNIIRGGSGGTTGYSKLANTWSNPLFTKITYGGVSKLVLMFGGGYDQDVYNPVGSIGTHPTSSNGNTIFIADALTGSLLWNATGYSGMDYSFAADLRAVSIGGTGVADHIYAADLGGQVWRFDLDPAASSASNMMRSVSGRMAVLSSSGAANDRRFFYAPDVAVINKPGLTTFVSVSLGSGNRAWPTSDTTTSDYFFVLRDTGVLKQHYPSPEFSGTLPSINFSTSGDLKFLTEDDITATATEGATTAKSIAADYKGWALPMGILGGDAADEKILSEALTYNGIVLVTSYIPNGTLSSSCSAVQGKGRLYALDVTSGMSANNDAYTNIESPGIAPSVQFLLTAGSDGKTDATLLTGTNPFDWQGGANSICEKAGVNCGEAFRLLQRRWRQMPNN